ncbi:FMN reductase [Bacterioplanes sanyensis]|uniref:NADPH-dependent FMN reductase n=1 Tax=Bacterioplanes sanyensis TaxID=1249553 RepID=UPI00167541D4|nr:NAD(P)H-dependent oxidoreductase [Bacterioplanes sanyensis]GGY31593.1 FMN reductase [Bacterioplanes sanyensis]
MSQICIISASQRAGSNSRRISDVLNQHYLGGQASLIDLQRDPLPFWDGDTAENTAVEDARSKAQAADGFVFVVPEWHGMVPAALKNLLLWLGSKELAHKPVLLTAVSASAGGAFVIAELRGSGYKNSRLLYLPEHLILRDANDLWQGQEERESDAYLDKRARYAIDQLTTYATALAPLREQLTAGLTDFANGMS